MNIHEKVLHDYRTPARNVQPSTNCAQPAALAYAGYVSVGAYKADLRRPRAWSPLVMFGLLPGAIIYARRCRELPADQQHGIYRKLVEASPIGLSPGGYVLCVRGDLRRWASPTRNHDSDNDCSSPEEGVHT